MKVNRVIQSEIKPGSREHPEMQVGLGVLLRPLKPGEAPKAVDEEISQPLYATLWNLHQFAPLDIARGIF